ncbi:hypothetical protein P691DRAFT_731767 [Macrolepiota fuliginosa MF-IS2]|uniref:Transmembrane protein n=1 Tax=Macrolepiota fuliginosa MF-IS2 TaxID=1400762 RepID=A0A9P5XBL1_9AGAR|nr:hypothetical protein P691DRAFT_731767 [Macrolepiota fuliginosa MF-IS2]
MAPDRWVVTDDNDTDITYTGPWFKDAGTKGNVGNFGPPYLNTLHGISSNGVASFVFSGTAVQVWGTSIINGTTNPDPTFECFVDDVSIGREPPFQFPENNWLLCDKTGLPDGSHTLRVDVKVVSPDHTFWVDQIRYVPSPTLPLDNKVILLDNTDPAIKLDSQWSALGGTANMTTHTNSIALVDFIGTSVSWVAFIPTELPHGGATGSWSIDGGNENIFILNGLPAGSSSTVYNQVFFTTTPEVQQGSHVLKVTFLGTGQTTPLGLDMLYVKNGTFSAINTQAPVPSAQSPPPSTQTPATGGSLHSSLGAILGGVIGGCALLLLILVGAFLCWRRRRREGFITEKGAEYSPTPFDPFRDDDHLPPDPGSVVTQTDQSYVYSPSRSHEAAPVASPLPGQQSGAHWRKQRDAYGEARYLGDNVPLPLVHDRTDSNASSWQRTIPSADESVPLQHADSGVRLGGHPIEEVPPHYTPD